MTRTQIETHIAQSLVHWTCSNPSTTSPTIGSSILALPFRFPGRRMCQPTSSKRQSDDMSNQAQRACYPNTHTPNLYTCRTQGAQPHALSLPPGLFQKLDCCFQHTEKHCCSLSGSVTGATQYLPKCNEGARSQFQAHE